jgi:AraC family transcriptional regulator
MSIWFSPNDMIKRRAKSWGGIEAVTLQANTLAALEYGHKSSRHVLMVAERAVREDGETSIAGIETSTLHDYSGRLTFVPAGHEFHGWQRPRELLRSMIVTFDHDSPLIDPALRFNEIDFQPRLFFFDEMLWTAAMALKKQVENVSGHPESYGDALVAVLAHRLVQLHGAEIEQSAAGIGLAPPHRYVTRQRIERAKRMLAQGDRSVAEIGFEVGFGESSSFTAAFRKMTGTTPARFRRQQE